MYFNIRNNIIFVVVLITLVTPLAWTKTIKDDFTSERAKKIIKLSKAAEIKAFLNTKIDPCNDFYSFSCGAWKNNNPVKSGEIATDKFMYLSEGSNRRFNELFDLEKTGNKTVEVENKIVDFYQSCRNIKNNHTQYRLALAKVYKEFGQFSFLKTEKQSTKSHFQWWSTVAKIQNIYGKSIILAVNILDDIKNKSRIMLYLGTPDFDMTQSELNDISKMQEAKIKTFLQLVFDIEDEKASKVANELMEFEYSLTAGATDVRLGKSVEELLILYNTTALKESYKDLFDVETFLEIVLGTKDLPEQLYVYDESYLENLIDVFNSTDERIVENYVLWLLLQEYIVDAADRDIDKVCQEKSKKYFGPFVDHAIYNQYRTKEAEANIYELWQDIKAQFRYNLKSENYNWMSNATREHAIEKLNNMKLTINSYDNDNFTQFYKNLDIDTTNYVVNLQNILKHSESLRDNKMDKKAEGIEDAEVTSYTPVYNLFTNHITIPIALLQPHYIWNPNYPKATQYATLGYLIAHEMIHGFDDDGRNYDANGNARSWWDEKSTNEFESRRKCFQAQYHNYTYAGHHLPESVSQTENIADNAGLKLAYSAYLRWLLKQKDAASNVEASERLPRLIYNNRELFLISFAQVWCEETHPHFRSSLANNDLHAPAMYRVIGSLSNFREFAWIWNCKNESRMVSSNICEIY